jgi:hypothetical protein
MHDRLPQGLLSLPSSSNQLGQNTGSLATAVPPMPAVANKLPRYHPGSNASGWHQAGAAPTLQRAQLLRPSDLPSVQESTTAHAPGRHGFADGPLSQPPVKGPPPLQSTGAAHGSVGPLQPQCSDVYHLAGEHTFCLQFVATRCVLRAADSGM